MPSDHNKEEQFCLIALSRQIAASIAIANPYPVVFKMIDFTNDAYLRRTQKIQERGLGNIKS